LFYFLRYPTDRREWGRVSSVLFRCVPRFRKEGRRLTEAGNMIGKGFVLMQELLVQYWWRV
jgi:hypothetical protein